MSMPLPIAVFRFHYHFEGLSLFWTNCAKHGLGLGDLIRLMCEEPAKLCGFNEQKGKLAKGYDADLCIWDPSDVFTVTPDMIHFRNKANTKKNSKVIKTKVPIYFVSCFRPIRIWTNSWRVLCMQQSCEDNSLINVQLKKHSILLAIYWNQNQNIFKTKSIRWEE